MDLFAAGFNAWNQLRFGDELIDSDPEDVSTFSKVLTDHVLEPPRAGLYYTLGYHVAGTGFVTGNVNLDHIGTTFVAGNGLTLSTMTLGNSAGTQSDDPEAFSQFGLVKYASHEDFKVGKRPTTFPCESQVRQVAVYQAGFAVLLQDGTVATLGDARYQECLARDITQESAANNLGLVPDLMSLGDPVKHITASGYVLAALTESGSVYIWGHNPGGTKRQGSSVFEKLSGIPNYWEVGGGLDVQDFALGESHAIALTTDGGVYVIGANRNGQLGLGQGRGHDEREWSRVELELSASHHVVGVAAGPRSSFIITAQK
ncbi:hypothetical protein EsHS_00002688 [Epichloe bromicola]